MHSTIVLGLLIPAFANGQIVIQDSTINHAPLGNFSNENIYRTELNDKYFFLLQQSDSILMNFRLRFNERLRNRVGQRFISSDDLLSSYYPDSAGVTYYTGDLKNYSLYFRRTFQVPWSTAPRNEFKRQYIPLISLHGNAYYEFLYRSRLDTPYSANNFQQHVEQIYADLVYKGEYPFRVILTARQSNSPYFKNYVDANIQFSQFAFRRNIKDKIIRDIENQINISGKKKETEVALKSQLSRFDSLSLWIEHPGRMQEIIEEKEKRLSRYLKLAALRKQSEDSLVFLLSNKNLTDRNLSTEQKKLSDSLSRGYNRIADSISVIQKRFDTLKALSENAPGPEHSASLKHLLDSLRAIITAGRKKADSIKSIVEAVSPDKVRKDLLDSLQFKLQKIDSTAKAMMEAPTEAEKKLHEKRKELEEISGSITKYRSFLDSLKISGAKKIADAANELNNAKSAKEINTIIRNKNTVPLDKRSQLLLSVKQFGIGKSIVDYSELTVKNLSLTGFNLEYKNNFYAALAAGQVDYRFKDFIPDRGKTKQNLLLGRYGWLSQKNTSIIFTAYTGTKQNYLSQSSLPLASEIPPVHVMGYGLEVNYALTPNIDLTAEVVKSSVPYRGTDMSEAIHKAFAFGERSNEAWSCKLDMNFPLLQSSVKAFYRKTGANFQSYSIFNSGSQQESWGIKWQQYLWRRQLSFTGQIRKNDFENPLASLNYKSTSVLKSIQGVFRKRKWPLFTIAYMPTAQLTKAPGEILIQNIFYSLNASVSQSYRRRNAFMNTTFFYNKFYTRGTDTGFVFFGAESARLNQDIQAGRFGSHSALDLYMQPGLTYYTVTENIDVTVSSVFSLGLGGKSALLKSGNSYLGGSAKMILRIRSLGTLQAQYDKDFLPDYTRSGLTGLTWGRIIWTKTF